MDDYYELLGVDEDAPVDDIRSAYRDKKAAVDTSAGDDAKSDVAKLNKAWNVLSDPYQRGRYDQQRNIANDDDDEYDDDEYEDDEDDAAPVTRSRSPRGADRAEKRRNARQPLKPTVKLPAGVHFPTMKQRLLAMGIDMLILIGLFFAGSIAVLPALEKSQHPDGLQPRARAREDRDPRRREGHERGQEGGRRPTPCSRGRRQGCRADAKAEEKKLKDELTKQNKVLLPLQNLMTGVVFLVALLILVLPYAVRQARRSGKETQHIRVIRMDGAPARFGDVLRRYGMLVLAGLALSLLSARPAVWSPSSSRPCGPEIRISKACTTGSRRHSSSPTTPQ